MQLLGALAQRCVVLLHEVCADLFLRVLMTIITVRNHDVQSLVSVSSSMPWLEPETLRSELNELEKVVVRMGLNDTRVELGIRDLDGNQTNSRACQWLRKGGLGLKCNRGYEIDRCEENEKKGTICISS
jgi:hypothetical protein